MEAKCAEKIGVCVLGDLWEQGSNGGGYKINKINRPMANTEPKGSEE